MVVVDGGACVEGYVKVAHANRGASAKGIGTLSSSRRDDDALS